MLITSGYAKGHFLHEPKIKGLNPAQALLRKSLFDTMQDKIIGKKVLDLFAGTGSFGLEALSRGSTSADFVEIDSSGVAALKKNINHTHFLGRTKIYFQPVSSFLAMCTEKYDVVFIDPPKSYSNYFELFDMVRKVLTKENLIIFRSNNLPIIHPRVTVIKELKSAYDKIYILTIKTESSVFS